MNILVSGTTILAGDPIDTGDRYTAQGCDYPKNAIGEHQIIDVTLPADFSPSRYQYANGALVAIPPTKEEHNAPILAQIKTLEDSVTERRRREAIVSDAGKAWLANVDAQIAALRAQLK